MCVLTRKKYKNKYHIPKSLVIIATIVLIYVLYLIFSKLFFSIYGIKHLTDNRDEPRKLILGVQKVKYSRFKIVDEKLSPLEELQIWRRSYKKRVNIKSDFAEVYEIVDEANYPIVPNYVHYLRLNEPEFTLTDAICMLSMYKNHIPSKIFVHTNNSNLSGVFWEKVQNTKGLRLILNIIPIDIPKFVFGQQIDMKITRHFLKLKILLQHGGIFLDKDLFIVKSLDKYLQYEMTLHWDKSRKMIDDKVIISSTKSQFLNVWLRGYKHFLSLPYKRFEPLEYATYKILWGVEKKKVFLDKVNFLIDISKLELIYREIWFKWHERDLVWLMEDAAIPDIKKKVKGYEDEVTAGRNIRRVGTNISDEFSKKDEEAKEVQEKQKSAFLQMLEDVFY